MSCYQVTGMTYGTMYVQATSRACPHKLFSPPLRIVARKERRDREPLVSKGAARRKPARLVVASLFLPLSRVPAYPEKDWRRAEIPLPLSNRDGRMWLARNEVGRKCLNLSPGPTAWLIVGLLAKRSRTADQAT